MVFSIRKTICYTLLISVSLVPLSTFPKKTSRDGLGVLGWAGVGAAVGAGLVGIVAAGKKVYDYCQERSFERAQQFILDSEKFVHNTNKRYYNLINILDVTIRGYDLSESSLQELINYLFHNTCTIDRDVADTLAIYKQIKSSIKSWKRNPDRIGLIEPGQQVKRMLKKLYIILKQIQQVIHQEYGLFELYSFLHSQQCARYDKELKWYNKYKTNHISKRDYLENLIQHARSQKNSRFALLDYVYMLHTDAAKLESAISKLRRQASFGRYAFHQKMLQYAADMLTMMQKTSALIKSCSSYADEQERKRLADIQEEMLRIERQKAEAERKKAEAERAQAQALERQAWAMQQQVWQQQEANRIQAAVLYEQQHQKPQDMTINIITPR